MKLSELKIGESAIIVKVRGYGEFRHRITEMGFVRGKEVHVVRRAPLRDPIEYRIMGYDVSLRHTEAELIEVVPLTEHAHEYNENLYETVSEESIKTRVIDKQKHIHVAFVGNPNSGKTTLFNALSGSREKVGNYSGVTVDLKRTTRVYNDYTLTFVDMPGTYSLSAYSQEELFVRNYIFNEVPDIVINVVDAGNLERNLYLTTQLIDMDIKVVMALNMFDEMVRNGAKLDNQSLAKMLGIPMIPTVGSKGTGVNALLQKIVAVYEDLDPVVRHIHINYGQDVEKSLDLIDVPIRENKDIIANRSSRYLSIRMLESDVFVRGILSKADNFTAIHKITKESVKRIEKNYSEKTESVIADARYGFISGALKETYTHNHHKRRQGTEIIDTFMTHKLFGFPIFFLFMFLMFYTTFNLGQYPMEWIETGVSTLNSYIGNVLPSGPFKDLLTEGIINGMGSVLVFLPNIVILFFFISLMEDTGYMARAAFIMDKVMHKIGLHGKSFIPLIMGFGCNVPAILSTRILENKNDRLLTMLINPFMSCSARLPVYILFISAFFPSYPTLMLMSIYTLGIVIAIVTALMFKKTLFKQSEAPFVMELPPYRIPTIKVIVSNMWDKSVEYLRKVGGVILIAVIIIWSLGYFPTNSILEGERDQQIALVEKTIENKAIAEQKVDSIVSAYKAQHLDQSYLKAIGKTIEPILQPAGMDWQLGISIVTGIAAKEVIIGTLSVIYQANENNGTTDSLNEILSRQAKNDPTSKNKLTALSFIVFVLIYFPCIGVVTAVKRETGTWKWPLFLVFYTSILAWIASVIVFQVGSLFIG
ncbi:MAG: ferrous iron transport protein B [Salinivirgaceae bacterium]|nr:ferrous iron transport protein B [Salinivirgaceae bacterium]MDD4747433.1 ferrous iron transport protein B [Salinivirgaceae bacterium]